MALQPQQRPARGRVDQPGFSAGAQREPARRAVEERRAQLGPAAKALKGEGASGLLRLQGFARSEAVQYQLVGTRGSKQPRAVTPLTHCEHRGASWRGEEQRRWWC